MPAAKRHPNHAEAVRARFPPASLLSAVVYRCADGFIQPHGGGKDAFVHISAVYADSVWFYVPCHGGNLRCC